MFYHIIMKNFKSNLKNYILFFVSNILAIAELFAFWGLNDVVKKAVKDGVTAATLKSDFVLAAGLITFITVFLMIFSMKYYMKLRIKDWLLLSRSNLSISNIQHFFAQISATIHFFSVFHGIPPFLFYETSSLLKKKHTSKSCFL